MPLYNNYHHHNKSIEKYCGQHRYNHVFSKTLLMLIVTLTVVLALLFFLPLELRAAEPPYGFHQIILTAIANNPNQSANDKRVEASHEDIKAAWKNTYLPRLTVNSSTNFNINRVSVPSLPGNETQTLSLNAGVSASMTLYDGGAGYYQIQALKMTSKALEAQYNSTDSRSSNTKGIVAQSVFLNFSMVALYRSMIDLEIQVDSWIDEAIGKTKDPVIISRYRAKIASNEAQKDVYLRNLSQLEKEYQHIVYEEIPQNLATLKEANIELKKILAPYENDQDFAIKTAKEKNQNYLAKLYTYQALQLSNKSVNAVLTRPRISLTAGDNIGRTSYSEGDGNLTVSTGPYVGVTMTYNFQAGMFDTKKGNSLREEAARDEVDAQEKDFEFLISSNIESLKELDDSVVKLENQYQSAKYEIEKLLKGGDANLKDPQALFELIDSFSQISSILNSTLQQTLQRRYTLEVAIGILFEQLGL